MHNPGCDSAATDVMDSELDGSNAFTNRRASEQATRAVNARNVSGRRRFVDPTTCEKDYSQAEMGFMSAMQDYKNSVGECSLRGAKCSRLSRVLGTKKCL